MAIAIKSIPILKDKVAQTFDKKVVANITKKSTINFSKEVALSFKILAKAKL
jgi:hypothetical protein